MELKEKEKIDYYQDLARDLRKRWKVKARVVPIDIGALWTIPKGLVVLYCIVLYCINTALGP